MRLDENALWNDQDGDIVPGVFTMSGGLTQENQLPTHQRTTEEAYPLS